MTFDPIEVQTQYKTLFEENNGDVKIEARDGEIYVHSQIIGVNPLFRKMCNSNFKEGMTKHIKMEKYALKSVKEFFAYIYYKKKYDIKEYCMCILYDILEMATMYEIKSYAGLLLSNLLISLQYDDWWKGNIIDMLAYSKQYLLTDEQKTMIEQKCTEKINSEAKKNLIETIQIIYKIFRKCGEGDDIKGNICKSILDTLCDMKPDSPPKSIIIKLHKYNGFYHVCKENYKELNITVQIIDTIFIKTVNGVSFRHCVNVGRCDNVEQCQRILQPIDESKIIKKEDTEKGVEYEVFYYRHDY